MQISIPCRVCLVVTVSASHVVGLGFAPRLGLIKDHHKNITNCLSVYDACVTVSVWQCSRLSKRPGSVWKCLWGHALTWSPGIKLKSRVLYLGTGFLSSATRSSMLKKHYDGLISSFPLLSSPAHSDLLWWSVELWTVKPHCFIFLYTKTETCNLVHYPEKVFLWYTSK